MLTTRKILLASAVAAMVCSLQFLAFAGEKWDLPMQWPATNFYAKSAQKFVDRVKQETKGEMDITIHYNASLGYKGGEMLRVIRQGLVPIGDVTQRLQVGDEPFLGIEGLPYLATGYAEMGDLLVFSKPHYHRIAAKHNQKVLYTQPWPGQHVFSKKEIKTLRDMAKLKIRTVDANGTEFFKRLGAAPAQLPWGEVVPGLASGLLDGVTTSSSSGVDGRFWEFLNHCYLLDWQVPLSSINVNMDAWDKLKPDVRNKMELVAKEMEGEFWTVTINEDAVQMKTLSDHGIKFAKPDADSKKEIIKVAETMWKDFMDKIPESRPVISAYRQMIGK